MSGFTIENEGVERRIVYRLAMDEVIDNFGLSMVQDNEIEGLLPVLSAGNNGIEDIRYDIQSMVSLRTYLEASMSKKRLLDLFRGIIKIIQSTSMYLLESTMLVYDMDSIYVQRTPFKLAMIYLPVIREEYIWNVNETVRALFRSVIVSARFVVEQDNTYITEILNALNSGEEFTVAGFLVLLDKLDVDVYRHHSHDGEYTGTAVRYMADDSSANINNDNNTEYDEFQPDYGDNVSKREGSIGSRIVDAFRGLFGKRRDNASHLSDDVSDFNSYEVYSHEEPVMVHERAVYSDDTVMLSTNPVTEGMPYIMRVANNEIVAIDKRVFRIGKEERYADYRITDNAAISRAHAEIHVKDGICYLTDEDSLNHTYVNGIMLEGHTPEQLKSGDVIRFADEEYVFHG